MPRTRGRRSTDCSFAKNQHGPSRRTAVTLPAFLRLYVQIALNAAVPSYRTIAVERVKRVRNYVWPLALLIAFGISGLLPAGPSLAAERSVTVSVPDFDVTLNGNRVDNPYREYPLLTYKDITYVPMTWYDCRLLGLETTWSPQGGLDIVQANVAASYTPKLTSQQNSSRYNAAWAAFPISVNGKAIDNAAEPYPLLSFRNITYFPLTWAFAHDEFGWEYEWDDSKGLSIRSANAQLEPIDLPADAGSYGVAVFKGYYYYTDPEGTTNRIFRASVTDTANRELVHSYGGDSPYGFNRMVRFNAMGDRLWFDYHLGGAIMGHDEVYKISEDGKAELMFSGHFNVQETPYGTVLIDMSVPPSGHNLMLVPAGDPSKNRVAWGDPNLIYGWHITEGETQSSYTNRGNSITVFGDSVYVLASSYKAEKAELNRIYSVNLRTNETVRINNDAVSRFRIIDHKLYYVKDQDGYLYASNPDGTNERRISDREAGDWFDELDGRMFYTSPIGAGKSYLYKVEPSGESKPAIPDPLTGIQRANDKVVCILASEAEFGAKVLDNTGELILSIADPVFQVIANGDDLLIVSARDHTIQAVK